MKKLKALIIILLVINIALLIVLLTLSNTSGSNKQTNIVNNTTPVRTPDDLGMVIPDNYYFFVGRYNGEMPTNELYKSIHKLVKNVVPEVYENVVIKAGNVNQYYTQNTDYLNARLGTQNFQKFNNIVTELKKVKQGVEFDTCEIERDTFKEEGQYVTFTLKIHYKGGESTRFKVYFCLKDALDTPLIIYEPAKE